MTSAPVRLARISPGMRNAGTLILRWVFRWFGPCALAAVRAQAGALKGNAGGKDHSGNMSAKAAARAFSRSAPARNASTNARYFARNYISVFLSDAWTKGAVLRSVVAGRECGSCLRIAVTPMGVRPWARFTALACSSISFTIRRIAA